MTASQPSVLLVSDTGKPIAELRDALEQQGYTVLRAVSSAQALLRAVEHEKPDIVIIDTESPSRDTLEQLAFMNHAAPRPVVMFSADSDQQLIRAAVGAGVTAYMVEGLAAERLAPIIAVALARFDEESRLRSRLAEVEQHLTERKLIDQAKALLIARRHLSEPAAYDLLRRQAMEQGCKIAEVARRILAMAELIG